MKTEKKLTKKAFKDLCSFTEFTGRGVKFNAIYFDWQDIRNENNTIVSRGFKYGICENNKGLNKQQLFNLFYDWVVLGIEKAPFAFTYTKFASDDSQRFKTPISLDLSTWQ